MNWKDFGFSFWQTAALNYAAQLLSDKLAKRISREDFIQLVRLNGKILNPQLVYFHDLTPEAQADIVAADPQIGDEHTDWLILKFIRRMDTAFFGPPPTAADIVHACGTIEFEADGTTPKPIPANGTGYALRTGYFAYTSKGGFHLRFGQRYDINQRRFNLSFAAKMVN